MGTFAMIVCVVICLACSSRPAFGQNSSLTDPEVPGGRSECSAQGVFLTGSGTIRFPTQSFQMTQQDTCQWTIMADEKDHVVTFTPITVPTGNCFCYNLWNGLGVNKTLLLDGCTDNDDSKRLWSVSSSGQFLTMTVSVPLGCLLAADAFVADYASIPASEVGTTPADCSASGIYYNKQKNGFKYTASTQGERCVWIINAPTGSIIQLVGSIVSEDDCLCVTGHNGHAPDGDSSPSTCTKSSNAIWYESTGNLFTLALDVKDGCKNLNSSDLFFTFSFKDQSSSVTCDAEKMSLSVRIPSNAQNVPGTAFVSGQYTNPSCKWNWSAGDKMITFSINYQDCGVIFDKADDTYKTDIVLATVAPMITDKTVGYKVLCSVDLSMRTLLSQEVHFKDTDNILPGVTQVIAGTHAPLVMDMKILNKMDAIVSATQVGEDLKLRVTVTDGYGVFVKNCKVISGENNGVNMNIIDSNGCPMIPGIIKEFQQTNGANGVTAEFTSFKMADADRHHVECEADACQGVCPLPQCTLRSRRRVKYTLVESHVLRHAIDIFDSE